MVVDTSAMLSIILHVTDELAMATRVGEAVAAVMPAATYVELSILAKTWGRLGLDMLDSALAEAGIEVVSVSVSQARLAAEAYARYGKGRGHPARLN